MLGKNWMTIDKKPVEDVLALIKGLVGEGPRTVHVGTDSQQDRQVTQFVTVVCVLNPGKGGRGFYFTENVPRIASLRQRLLREVSVSVDVAMALEPELPECGTRLTVHVDANPDTQFKSSNYVQELAGYVAGQGFPVLVKPESWLATHFADHVVKNKVVGRGR